jgi:hypothetical protein
MRYPLDFICLLCHEQERGAVHEAQAYKNTCLDQSQIYHLLWFLMHQLLNETISFLERATEPAEWSLILGPRLFKLLSQYLDNDVIAAGFMYYIYCKL